MRQGDLGGFVQSEDNLSQEGNCWIFQSAIAAEDAVVAGDAKICDLAVIRGSALVSGNAVIRNRSLVEDRAIVMAGVVEEDSQIAGNARITENLLSQKAPFVAAACVYGEISGNIRLFPAAVVLPGQSVHNSTPDTIQLYHDHAEVVRPQDRNTPTLKPPENWNPHPKRENLHRGEER